MTDNEILSQCSGTFTDDFEEVHASNVTSKVKLSFFVFLFL